MNHYCEGQIIKVLQKVKRTEVEPKFYSVCLRNGATGHEVLYMGVHHALEDAIEMGKVEAVAQYNDPNAFPRKAWNPILYRMFTIEQIQNALVDGRVEVYNANEKGEMDSQSL